MLAPNTSTAAKRSSERGQERAKGPANALGRSSPAPVATNHLDTCSDADSGPLGSGWNPELCVSDTLPDTYMARLPNHYKYQ